MNKNLAVLALVLAAGCVGRFDADTVEKRDAGTAANPNVDQGYVPPMDPTRKVSGQNCGKPVDVTAGNLRCE